LRAAHEGAWYAPALMTLHRLRSRAAAICAVALGASAACAQSYVALGDSIGFGITNNASYTEFSDGDRGYVGLYADALGARHGGVRPNVINLSVFGDRTASFFTTEITERAFNTHYTGLEMSQRDRFLRGVADEAAAGRTVDHVTISLGANDLIHLALDPAFQALPQDQQIALAGQALADAAQNLGAIYGLVRSTLPEAEIIALGYYDPFPAVPDSPATPLAGFAIPILNQIIEGTGETFGVEFVNVFPAFVGREAELTYMTSEEPIGYGVHPTPEGYRVIAGVLVPAPPAGCALAVGGLWVTRRRRIAG
jgi:lysophospholipase L1-like esterase